MSGDLVCLSRSVLNTVSDAGVTEHVSEASKVCRQWEMAVTSLDDERIWWKVREALMSRGAWIRSDEERRKRSAEMNRPWRILSGYDEIILRVGSEGSPWPLSDVYPCVSLESSPHHLTHFDRWLFLDSLLIEWTRPSFWTTLNPSNFALDNRTLSWFDSLA